MFSIACVPSPAAGHCFLYHNPSVVAPLAAPNLTLAPTAAQEPVLLPESYFLLGAGLEPPERVLQVTTDSRGVKAADSGAQ